MTHKCIGWILDVYIEHDQAILWIKTEDGKALKLTDEYEPIFYIQPKNEKSGKEIIQALSELELIKKRRWDYKLIDINNTLKQKLIYVCCYSIHHYNLLLKVLQNDTLRERIQQLFNTRLSHIQQYLFTQLRIQPTTKVSIEYEDGALVSIDKLVDHEYLESPFSTLYVEVTPFTEQMVLDRDDPIKSISVKYEDEEMAFEVDESTLLERFSNYVLKKDPDIVVFSKDNILDYLFQRIKLLSLDLALGRLKTDIYSGERNSLEKWSQGRIYITFFENGIAGLIELSQFSYLPLRMILQYSIGRLIANRNLYEVLARDYAISDNNTQGTYEQIRSLEEIMGKDKAGMIFSPQIGLHQNVAVLDYNDEFANIIVNDNISYERMASNRQSDRSSLGILPHVVKQVVERHLYFKELLRQLPHDTIEANHCEKRTNTLKKILVCLYGTTGSYWNKYGNVLVFEEINRKSREILLKTKDIVQELGYELIYADTDAAFVHKDNATKDDYEKLGEIISRETGLALSLEYHYRFLVLLPLEADEKLEALKHYFGITYDGELVTRGIETRRHDSPNLIKDFQTELLYTLFDADTPTDIIDRTLENALLCVTKTIDKIMTGEIETQDLVISKQLRMHITKYKNIFPHVAAAIQLNNANYKAPIKGENIEYIYVDSQHQNPLQRVVAAQQLKDNNSTLVYDKEKYKEMLLDAAETVLGVFGFDRTLYGKAKDKKWWMEMKRNRMRDVEAETATFWQ